MRDIDTLDIVYSRLMRGNKPDRRVGDGKRRAIIRQQANAKPPPEAGKPTRQQLRRYKILRARQAETIAKVRGQ